MGERRCKLLLFALPLEQLLVVVAPSEALLPGLLRQLRLSGAQAVVHPLILEAVGVFQLLLNHRHLPPDLVQVDEATVVINAADALEVAPDVLAAPEAAHRLISEAVVLGQGLALGAIAEPQLPLTHASVPRSIS